MIFGIKRGIFTIRPLISGMKLYSKISIFSKNSKIPHYLGVKSDEIGLKCLVSESHLNAIQEPRNSGILDLLHHYYTIFSSLDTGIKVSDHNSSGDCHGVSRGIFALIYKFYRKVRRYMMREGVLVICFDTGRMDIRFTIEEYYGGLHCGTQLEALIDGNWIPTRIEMAEDWFLVGINTKNIAGLTVRIKN